MSRSKDPTSIRSEAVRRGVSLWQVRKDRGERKTIPAERVAARSTSAETARSAGQEEGTS